MDDLSKGDVRHHPSDQQQQQQQLGSDNGFSLDKLDWDVHFKPVVPKSPWHSVAGERTSIFIDKLAPFDCKDGAGNDENEVRSPLSLVFFILFFLFAFIVVVCSSFVNCVHVYWRKSSINGCGCGAAFVAFHAINYVSLGCVEK